MMPAAQPTGVWDKAAVAPRRPAQGPSHPRLAQLSYGLEGISVLTQVGPIYGN